MSQHDRIKKLTEALEHLQAIDTSVLDTYTRPKHTVVVNLVSQQLSRERSREHNQIKAMPSASGNS